MESLIPGLHASAPEVLPFATSLQIRAFLLRRERGNLLIYAAPAVEADAEAIGATAYLWDSGEAACSPATRSTSTTASGLPRCSRARATVMTT